MWLLLQALARRVVRERRQAGSLVVYRRLTQATRTVANDFTNLMRLPLKFSRCAAASGLT